MRYKNSFILVLLASFLSLAASAAEGGIDSYKNLFFRLGLSGKSKEIRQITEIVTQYNKSTARYYSSVGEPVLVETIPASPLLKRRHVSDVTMLQRRGLAMVFDRDTQKIESVRFLARDTAVVLTREIWGMMLQESHTRKPLSSVKAAEVLVRYLLHKESLGAVPLMWVVYEADVYPKDAAVPDFIVGSVL